jgi:hypothetical protein
MRARHTEGSKTASFGRRGASIEAEMGHWRSRQKALFFKTPFVQPRVIGEI